MLIVMGVIGIICLVLWVLYVGCYGYYMLDVRLSIILSLAICYQNYV